MHQNGTRSDFSVAVASSVEAVESWVVKDFHSSYCCYRYWCLNLLHFALVQVDERWWAAVGEWLHFAEQRMPQVQPVVEAPRCLPALRRFGHLLD